jgi:hypothetical protein
MLVFVFKNKVHDSNIMIYAFNLMLGPYNPHEKKLNRIDSIQI